MSLEVLTCSSHRGTAAAVVVIGPPDEAEEVYGAMADVLLQARERFPDALREEVSRRNSQAQGKRERTTESVGR